jgi:hypothetical protein
MKLKQKIILIISIFLMTLVLTQCNSDESETTEESESDAQEGTPEACGNGICDSVEKEKGLCSADCNGEQTTQTSQTKQTSQTTQTTTSSQQSMQTGNEDITVETVDTSYAVADRETSGFFTSGQEADILLSGVDFNDAGGSLLFNHQTGIATDGTHLVLADRNNNRILIWNELPQGNEEADIVLGQENFETNSPGEGLNEFNWPIAVFTDGTHLVVADTYNDRILVWNSWPMENGEAADFAIKSSNIRWPWGVWTDGEKLIISSTGTSKILIWNDFPSENTEEDIVLTSDDIGTPRNVMSDGTNLAVGDHNAFSTEHGTFFWSEFPTKDDQPYDFYVENPKFMGEDTDMGAEIYGGAFTDDGAFIAIAHTGLFLWEGFPKDEEDTADITFDAFEYDGGDASSIAIADDIVYVSLSNGNRIVGFDGIPSEDREPDFVIGAPDIYTNTYASNYFITNPVPASDGEHLFVSSDYDKTLSVWKQLPDESNAHPDYVYHNVGGWDNALYENNFIIVGGNRKDTVYIWNDLPLGQEPDTILQGEIGNVEFKELTGVALDEKYLYIADKQANKVYVWEGIPGEKDDPVYTLESSEPTRLSSDGTYLAVTKTNKHAVDIYDVHDLESTPTTIGGRGTFNLPQGSEIADGHLFIGDTGNSYVYIWKDVEDALAGESADVKLGQGGDPQIGKDTLFWPATPSYDGSYLWLGEVKFSGRLLRFSPTE